MLILLAVLGVIFLTCYDLFLAEDLAGLVIDYSKYRENKNIK